MTVAPYVAALVTRSCARDAIPAEVQVGRALRPRTQD